MWDMPLAESLTLRVSRPARTLPFASTEGNGIAILAYCLPVAALAPFGREGGKFGGGPLHSSSSDLRR